MRSVLITSADNPRIKALAKLRKQRERRESSLFVAEGVREISRALAAGLSCVELYFCPAMLQANPGRLDAWHELQQALPGSLRQFELTEPLLHKLSILENPEGVLAVFEQRVWRLQDLKLQSSPLLLVAQGISKPGNLGAMARTAAAAGCDALLVADAVVDPFNPHALRAGTGATFSLPIVCADTPAIIAFLLESRIRIHAAMPAASASCYDARLTGSCALVIGAEDVGLDDRWRDAAVRSGGSVISIPMHTGLVDSLNASTAAAVLLFEAVRQRVPRA